jgi:hypothetical protein
MYASRGRINNKDKKYAGGNWGHPRKFTKRHTKIDDPLIPEKGVGSARKKKKKVKKEYKFSWRTCPFCNTEIPLDYKRIAEEKEKLKNRPYLGIWEEMYRVDECPNCHAKEVRECPACKRITWFNTDGVYRHQNWGCGFFGKKLDRRE